MNEKRLDQNDIWPPAVKRKTQQPPAEVEEKPCSLGIVLTGEGIYVAGWVTAWIAGAFGHSIIGLEALIGCFFLSFIVGVGGLLMSIAEIRSAQGQLALFAVLALGVLNAFINYSVGGH